MLFRVTKISSETIDFYIVPDDPAEIPRAKIEIAGDVSIVDPNQTMIDLVAKGRHQTGLCGFNVSMPQFKTRRHDINIYDYGTGLHIFRRKAGKNNDIRRRIIIPKYWSDLWDFSPSFLENFLYHYDFERDLKSSESLLEVTQNHCDSLCVTGHIPMADILYEFRDKLEFWAIIGNPDDHWTMASQRLGTPHMISNLSVEDLTASSDPLLKSIVNKGALSIIQDDDIQSAYKILSRASLFCLTSDPQWPVEETELDFPLINRCLNPASLQNNEDINFFKKTLIRNDIMFYENIYTLISDQ